MSDEHNNDIQEQIDELNLIERIAFDWLVEDVGYDPKDALERQEEVCIYEGSKEDYAAEIIEDYYDVPDDLIHYIDYEKFARHLKIEGCITEIAHNLLVTNAEEF